MSFASLGEQHLEQLEHRGHIGIEVDANGGQVRANELLVRGEAPFGCGRVAGRVGVIREMPERVGVATKVHEWKVSPEIHARV
jgi:hypothetical protein